MVNPRTATFKQKRNAVEVVILDIDPVIEESHLQEQDDFTDCYSVSEICEELGQTVRSIRNIIKECISKGTCEYAGKRLGMGIDGRVTKTPMYRFKFKNKNGTKME